MCQIKTGKKKKGEAQSAELTRGSHQGDTSHRLGKREHRLLVVVDVNIDRVTLPTAVPFDEADIHCFASSLSGSSRPRGVPTEARGIHVDAGQPQLHNLIEAPLASAPFAEAVE